MGCGRALAGRDPALWHGDPGGPPCGAALRRLNVRRLLALGPHLRLKGHLLPFREALESLRTDFREMREQIVTALIRRDEPKTLRIVEPLDCAGCHRFSFTRLFRPTAVVPTHAARRIQPTPYQ